MEHIFLHKSLQLITDKGFYSSENLPHNADVLCLDPLGYARFIRPSIIYGEESGLYYKIRTETFDFSLSANSDMYIGIRPYKKELVHSVCNTLIGTKIRVPAVPQHKQLDGYPISDINLVLYALTTLKRARIIDHGISVSTHVKKYQERIESLLDNAGVYYEKDDTLSSRRYNIYFQYVREKKISSEFVSRMNAEQAKRFIGVCIMFDTVGSYRKQAGYNVLCKPEHAALLTAVALKAGFRTHVGNHFGYERGIDSISIKKQEDWYLTILDCKMSENDTTDKIITFPERHKGVFAVADGHVFIIPNLKID